MHTNVNKLIHLLSPLLHQTLINLRDVPARPARWRAIVRTWPDNRRYRGVAVRFFTIAPNARSHTLTTPNHENQVGKVATYTSQNIPNFMLGVSD